VESGVRPLHRRPRDVFSDSSHSQRTTRVQITSTVIAIFLSSGPLVLVCGVLGFGKLDKMGKFLLYIAKKSWRYLSSCRFEVFTGRRRTPSFAGVDNNNY
jgi:hypothetical protein